MEKILEISNLTTAFHTREGIAKAVNNLDLVMNRGEILGVVGESGCGKSVTALSILRLVPHPGRIMAGRILFEGRDVLSLNKKEMRKIRGDRISMIFQEPMISLNPAFTIGQQLLEAVLVHRKSSKREAWEMVLKMLRTVEIPDPERRAKEYPHQLSGGMRQRAMIAESLLLKPKILLADEPTTALDVTIQAQILDLMYTLTQEMETAIMLITHNLGIVAEYAQRVMVMYSGKVVEQGLVGEIFENPKHPYTHGLLKAVPHPGQWQTQKRRPLFEIEGIVPSLLDLPSGCPFNPRCHEKRPVCEGKNPPLVELSEHHSVSCWLVS